jgi:DNA (cytosine-5)-methyltransferase 1
MASLNPLGMSNKKRSTNTGKKNKKRTPRKPSVLDLFCGAGGFSEGFRQQGFMIIAGYDHWKPAVDTYSHNFGEGKGRLLDLLSLERSVALIESMPDSDVIIGSPPCVSFSSSNLSGKADKSLGLRLTKVFLKVVALKKYKQGSILKAWFMENVQGSIDYVSKGYTFSQLGLKKWAKENGYDPSAVALCLAQNHTVINAADYGSPQQRIRAVAGEIIAENRLVVPKASHTRANSSKKQPEYITLGRIRQHLPSPTELRNQRIVQDPLYNNIRIKLSELTDQFYDTGLYESEWSSSRYQKINHPYMGRMSFPENESKPSRTITATTIGTSREAIIYRSEYKRVGHGEYRTPTAREAATLMSFPITYQFLGREGAKCRLIGNAVCPSVSRALAGTVRQAMRLPKKRKLILQGHVDLSKVNDLSTFQPKKFNEPPKKKPGARFRGHPFKDGNITVTLSNYDIIAGKKCLDKRPKPKWITSVQYGNGKGFPHKTYPDGFYLELEPLIRTFERGEQFIEVINNGFSETIAKADVLQKLHEAQENMAVFRTPLSLIDKLASIIEAIPFTDPHLKKGEQSVFTKDVVPKKQVLALYAINKICTVANN